ncbi:MAG: type IV pilus twitching motility protein PilT [Chitinophagales bacterium]
MIKELIEKAVEIRASDLHLTVFKSPVFRVNGELINLPEYPKMTVEQLKDIADEMLPGDAYRERLEEDGQVDFSSSLHGVGRFRVNLYIQRGSYAAAIRLIPFQIPELDDLGLPPVVRELAIKDRGLVIVTGRTGSGKSTTLAAMINLLNKEKSLNIITLEDPIEYLYRHEKSIVNQREVGVDTSGFAPALRAALRQDPDVILVGEMRDLETISTAVTAAETGHLVLATLHSSSAAQTVDRIIDVFPPHQQEQIRVQLGATIQGIVSQQLIPRADGRGRVVAAEILIATPAVRSLIRDGKTYQIDSVIETGASLGMVTMDKTLKNLYQKNLISYDEASKRASGRGALMEYLRGGGN